MNQKNENLKNSNLKLPFYFISDTHISTILSKNEIEKRKDLFSLFEKIIETKGTLFLLGDFFDFWFDHGNYIHKNLTEVVEYLKEIKKAGIEIHFIAGNHDYWIEGFLTKNIGLYFYPNKIEFIHNDKKFLLMHGDGLLKRDSGYRLLKKILRSKIIISLFKILPASLIYKIGEKVSNITFRYNNSTVKLEDVDEMIKFMNIKNNADHDIVMMGHIHYPKLIKTNDKYSIILGDWIRHRSYVVWDGKEISHLEWRRE
ncbi:MAG: UDP-2,3-diacylglucosamine diphosphatase [Candidatus Marinimicrobia bacterium]|nr:UDP-2,3-diacylglucosamine diphosphatase [Candidatus Neomarinimicrobiota bacterium]